MIPQNEPDKLCIMFEMQRKLQERLKILERIKDKSMLQQYINQNLLAIHEEAVEIMRETAYKNPDYVPFGWKKDQQFNIEKYKDEIVDIIHFIMNLCIAVDMSADEFFQRYLNKNKENFVRQDENY